MQVNAALDFDDTQRPDAHTVTPGAAQQNVQSRPTAPTTPTWGINDAATAFRNGLRLMQNQIYNNDFIFDKASFENMYRLTWFGIGRDTLLYMLRRVVQPDNMRIGGTFGRARISAWPGFANTVPLSNLPADFEIIPGSLYIWSESRVANHRACVTLLVTAEGLIINPVAVSVAPTAD